MNRLTRLSPNNAGKTNILAAINLLLADYETAAGFSYLMRVGYTACMIVWASFTYRNALPTVIGFSVVFAFGAHSLLNDNLSIL